MRPIERSTQFKRDYKKALKSIQSSELNSRLTEVIGYISLWATEPGGSEGKSPMPAPVRDVISLRARLAELG